MCVFIVFSSLLTSHSLINYRSINMKLIHLSDDVLIINRFHRWTVSSTKYKRNLRFHICNSFNSHIVHSDSLCSLNPGRGEDDNAFCCWSLERCFFKKIIIIAIYFIRKKTTYGFVLLFLECSVREREDRGWAHPDVSIHLLFNLRHQWTEVLKGAWGLSSCCCCFVFFLTFKDVG